MGEATTRRRAPSPSNTRKFVEADARSTDLLPKSSRSHARRPSTNFPQVRDEPEFILHDLAGPYPVQNSPSTPGSAAHPVQNSPSKRPWQAHPVQNSPSEPQNADFGPLFACRENFVPLPPPTTRAGRTLSRMQSHFRYKTLPARPARRPTRYKTLPASGSAAHPVQNSPSKPQNADFGPLFACRENFVPLPPPTRQAGRKKSRTNTPPHPPTRPSPNFACNSIE